MILHQLRWMAAGLAAVAVVFAAPSRSNADVQILVEELDAGGGTVASKLVSSPNGPLAVSFAGVYFTGIATLSTNSDSGSSTASLTPAFTAGRLTPAFDVTQDHKLRITVTDDKFMTSTNGGTLKSAAGASNGFADGIEKVETFALLFDSKQMTVPASSQTQLATGPILASVGTNPPTDPPATVTQPGPDRADEVKKEVVGIPSPFAIQQVILVSFSGPIPPAATFGATGGASLESSAVPAPGGLALALIALPLLGLRRSLRKTAAA